MIGRVRDTWPVRRVSAFVNGIWDTFLRDNKVIPPILAVVALLAFAWIVAGSFIGTPDNQSASSNGGGGEMAQSPDPQQSQVVPEIENPNLDSYAAYESKDPFRQLFESADAGETTGDDSTGEDTSDPADSSDGSTSSPDDGSGGSGATGGPNGGNGGGQGSGNGSGGNGSGGNGGNGGNGGGQGDGSSRPDPTAGAADGQYDDQGDITDPGNGNGTDQTNANGGQGGGNGSGGSGNLFESGGDLSSPGGRGGN